MLTIPSDHLRIGDTLRFPLGRLGSEEPVYRHRFEIAAFTRSGEVVVRRLADGFTRTVSTVWANQYVTDDDRRLSYADDGTRQETRRERLAWLRARQLPTARAEVERLTGSTTPCHYVTAIKGKRYVALLGPFEWHTARLFVDKARHHANTHYDDPWCEIAYGVSRIQNPHGATPGKFNSALLGVQS